MTIVWEVVSETYYQKRIQSQRQAVAREEVGLQWRRRQRPATGHRLPSRPSPRGDDMDEKSNATAVPAPASSLSTSAPEAAPTGPAAQIDNPRSWDHTKVLEWAAASGLRGLDGILKRDPTINGDRLIQITDGDLKTLGVSLGMMRRKIGAHT